MPTHSPEHRAGITLDETGQVIDETAELLMRIKRFKKEQVKRREQLARDKIIVQAMMMAIGGATDEEITQQFPYLPIPLMLMQMNNLFKLSLALNPEKLLENLVTETRC